MSEKKKAKVSSGKRVRYNPAASLEGQIQDITRRLAGIKAQLDQVYYILIPENMLDYPQEFHRQLNERAVRFRTASMGLSQAMDVESGEIRPRGEQSGGLKDDEPE